MKSRLSLLLAAVFATGCASMGGAPGPSAIAKLQPTKGNSASGSVTFEQHGAKVLLKYHLMEVREQPLTELQRWAAETPLLVALWERQARPGTSAQAWLEHLVHELVAQGALARDTAGVRDV